MKTEEIAEALATSKAWVIAKSQRWAEVIPEPKPEKKVSQEKMDADFATKQKLKSMPYEKQQALNQILKKKPYVKSPEEAKKLIEYADLCSLSKLKRDFGHIRKRGKLNLDLRLNMSKSKTLLKDVSLNAYLITQIVKASNVYQIDFNILVQEAIIEWLERHW